ncbi:hypothetical protein MAR_026941 [Mya arenaria]|uniref:Uncharacterized protein n=1 Tax=Mya arenaria TaxID=6604 RepID=A0ABY7F060_MYAAR|nr:hypothetical protein MAR_026941 [Mya arenaria]
MDICSILFVLGSLVSMVGGQAECERYSTIALEEVKCRPYVKYFNMVVPWFFGHDEALTNEELLNEVKDKCTFKRPVLVRMGMYEAGDVGFNSVCGGGEYARPTCRQLGPRDRNFRPPERKSTEERLVQFLRSMGKPK